MKRFAMFGSLALGAILLALVVRLASGPNIFEVAREVNAALDTCRRYNPDARIGREVATDYGIGFECDAPDGRVYRTVVFYDPRGDDSDR